MSLRNRQRLQLLPLDGWRDASAEMPDRMTTFLHENGADSAALQFSFAFAKDAAGPLSNETLRKLANNLEASGSTLLATDGGTCRFGRYMSSTYRLNESTTCQLWVLSDGRNLIFATLTASDMLWAERRPQVLKVVMSATLADTPWYHFW